MAGGWSQAALLPCNVALALAEDYLKKEQHTAHADSLKIWAALSGLYAMGGDKFPDPPEPPEDF